MIPSSSVKGSSVHHCLFLLTAVYFINAIAHPIAISEGQSSVSFTSYKRVSPSEWREFYHGRGGNNSFSKPIIPAIIRPGIIPVVHYSYQIQHLVNAITRDLKFGISDRSPRVSQNSDKITFPVNQTRLTNIHNPQNNNTGTGFMEGVDDNIRPRPRPIAGPHFSSKPLQKIDFGPIIFPNADPNKDLNIATCCKTGNLDVNQSKIQIVDDSSLVDEFNQFLQQNSPETSKILNSTAPTDNEIQIQI